jgi:hypothetical protein
MPCVSPAGQGCEGADSKRLAPLKLAVVRVLLHMVGTYQPESPCGNHG